MCVCVCSEKFLKMVLEDPIPKYSSIYNFSLKYLHAVVSIKAVLSIKVCRWEGGTLGMSLMPMMPIRVCP